MIIQSAGAYAKISFFADHVLHLNDSFFVVAYLVLSSGRDLKESAIIGNRTLYRHPLYIDSSKSKSTFDIQWMTIYSESSALYIDILSFYHL